MNEPIAAIEMRGIEKRFGTIRALYNVDFTAYAGTINAVIGENGAGKSTLVKVLYGLLTPDAGSISIDARPVPRHYRPRNAIARGLGMLQQHFSLIPEFSALDNIILGSEPLSGPGIDFQAARDRINSILAELGASLDLDEKVANLSVSERQHIEIARMLYTGAKVLIFDEPTATLAPQETIRLYSLLRRLSDNGSTIIVITHRLAEVLEHADHVTVLRRGEVTARFLRGEMTENSLISAMVPEAIAERANAPAAIENSISPILLLDGVSCFDDSRNELLSDISLKVRPGEIVGIAGVSGSGQLELAETIIGLRQVTAGTVSFDGTDITNLNTSQRRELGFVYIPEDRYRDGIIPQFSLTMNRLLGDHRKKEYRSRISYRMAELRQDMRGKIERFDIDAADIELPIAALSGGNQQKLVLARELERNPRVIVAHGPTRGLDVLASLLFYKRLMDLAKHSAATILISSEIDDLLHFSNRIYALYNGSLIEAGLSAELDSRKIGLLMTRGEAA